MNLHHIVRGIIQTVHKDEPCYLIQAIGQSNVKGIVTPVYKKPFKILAQIQPAGSETLQMLEAFNVGGESMQAFLYSDPTLPVASVNRLPLTRGGDIVKRKDGTFWLVTAVLSDWTEEGWACVAITRQTSPPNFSNSDWGDSD